MGTTTAKIALGVFVFVLFNAVAGMAWMTIVSMDRKEKPKSKRLERLEVEVETALERIPKIIELVDFNGDGKLCHGETTNLLAAIDFDIKDYDGEFQKDLKAILNRMRDGNKTVFVKGMLTTNFKIFY